MSTKKKTSPRGIRYTDAQKQEVVAFVAKYNSDKGRGGQSAAAKKFKVTPLTISAWLKGAGKSPSKAKAVKPAKAARAAKDDLSSKKGKRYTAEEKQQVVDFVNDYNTKNGRGGQSRAAKQFGLSVLTVSSWLKNPKVSSSRAVSAAVPAGLAAKVSELISVTGQISRAEADLGALRAKYEKIKASIQSSL